MALLAVPQYHPALLLEYTRPLNFAMAIKEDSLVVEF
jgi:hypothetical protein